MTLYCFDLFLTLITTLVAFQAAHQKNLFLTHIEELLETAKQLFVDAYTVKIKDSETLHEFSPDFDETFDRLLNRLEEKDSQVFVYGESHLGKGSIA